MLYILGNAILVFKLNSRIQTHNNLFENISLIVSSEGCRIKCPVDQMKPILTKFNNTTDKCQAKIKNVFVSQTLITVVKWPWELVLEVC